MESVLFRILGDLNPSPADWFIFACGIAVVIWVALHIRRLKEERKDALDKLEQFRKECSRLDALNFGMAKAIQAANGNLKLIKESADGSGNYTLDRSMD